MPYLNLDTKYFAHPKTRRLVGLLGRASEVLPIKLWSYCGDFHCKDGLLTDYSTQAIEDIIGWWGKPGDAVAAMVKVGFLEEVPQGYQVHDWLEHEGHILMLKEKAQAAANKRWSEHRERIRCSRDAPGITQAIPEQCLARGRLSTEGKAGTPDPDAREQQIAESNARIERIKPRLLRMYGRKETEQITDYAEFEALVTIGRREACEAELGELEEFRALPDSFFPQSLCRFLNSWQSVLDRARVRKRGNSNGSSEPPTLEQKLAREALRNVERTLGKRPEKHP